MASTFDNDLRLEEMATGENAGSWGTKTNTNLELIADAFGYGTFTIANADTTLTIPDGSGSDNALRSLYLKISSSADLTTTRVLTIDPNTVSKLWYIENNTSGGQTITISQGSGANVNILNGQAKLVATDGVGAGAAVIDVTQDLAIPDLFIDDDLSLQSDGAIINFGEDADITLTHAADTSLTLGGAGTTTGLVVNNTATDGDPFLSFALSGTQTFTMGIDDGDSDKFKIGTSAIGTDTRLTITSAGDFGIQTDAPDGTLHVHTGSAGTITAAAAANDLVVESDNAAGISILFDDTNTNAYGLLYFGNETDGNSDGRIEYYGSTYVTVGDRQAMSFRAGNVERMRLQGTSVVFNDTGTDTDFRVGSDNKTHMLFVDAGRDAVQIGANTSQSQGALDVGFFIDEDTTNVMTIRRGLGGTNTSLAQGFGFPYLTIGGSEYTTGGNYRGIGFGYWIPNNGYASSRPPAEIAYYDENIGSGTKGSLVFGTRDTTVGSDVPVERLRIHADGKVTINSTNTDSDFRVESVNNTNMLVVDAAEDRVGVGTTPSYTFHVADSDPILSLNDTGANSTRMQLQVTNSAVYYGTLYSSTNPHVIWTVGGSTPSAGTEIFRITNTADEVTFNGNGRDQNFRVATDDQSNMFVIDGGENKVGFGRFPSSSGTGVTQIEGVIQIHDDLGNVPLFINAGADYAGMKLKRDSTNASGGVDGWNWTIRPSYASGVASAGDISYLKINSAYDAGAGGQQQHEVVFNEDQYNLDFRVESDSKSHLFAVDASANDINFGNSSSSGQYNGTGANGMSFRNIGANGMYYANQNGSDSNIYLSKVSGYTDGRVLQFSIAGTTKGTVTVSSAGTTYATISDRRLKTDIEPLVGGTEKLMAMNPVTHKWKADPEADAVHGFIAQEMQEVVPEAVGGEDGGENMMSMDYGRITPVLVAALQDAHKKIEALEKRLAEMETK